MALFRSSSEQNIFSTVPQLHISAKGGKVFKSAGKQTIALTGQTIISSETGIYFILMGWILLKLSLVTLKNC